MTNKSGIAVVLAVILVGTGFLVFSNQRQKGNSRTILENPQSGSSAEDTDSVSTVETTVEPVQAISEIALTISSPLSGGSVSTATVAVRGKTSPKAEVFANEAEGLADASGNFSLTVALDEGENSIIVTAVDANGKVAETEVLVTYEVNE